MNKSNLNVRELLSMVVNFFDTIDACREFASCKFGYGFISRSTPKFCSPKATATEWYNVFGSIMPTIVKVTKVTNARAYNWGDAINRQLAKQGSSEKFVSDPMKGYKWVVPNIIKRSVSDSSLQLCVTFKPTDKTKFEPFYIVGDHFATEDELDFIKSHLYVAPNKSVKQSALGISDDDILMTRNYKFSNIIAVGTTPEVEEIWKNIR